MSKLLNIVFKNMFKKKSVFEPPQRGINKPGMWEIEVKKEVMAQMLGKLEVSKGIRPYEVLGHILKECWQQLTGPVWDTTKCSLNTGNVSKKWKRTHIRSIYKGESREDG